MKLLCLYCYIMFSNGVYGLQIKAESSRSNTALTLNDKLISRQRQMQSAKAIRIREKLIKVANLDTPFADQVMEATTPTVKAEECGKVNQFGDQHEVQWCQDAIDLVKEKQGSDAKGLSYGIFTWDNWSERMSKDNSVPTELYDCFESVDQIHSLQDNHLSEYPSPTKFHETCVGTEAKTDENGRQFETLDSHLKDKAPHSTFVKMDVEGDEWKVLEDLQKNPEALDKIASLDFEMHFCPIWAHESWGESGEESTKHFKEYGMRQENGADHNQALEVLKGLLDKFEVVGRSETDDGIKRSDDVEKRNKENCVVPSEMMSVSYVNKEVMNQVRNKDSSKGKADSGFWPWDAPKQ